MDGRDRDGLQTGPIRAGLIRKSEEPMPTGCTRRKFLTDCGRCALLTAALTPFTRPLAGSHAAAQELRKGYLEKKLSPYFTALESGSIRCELCPHGCEVAPGERGRCEVRENIDGRYYSLVYGNPCAVHVDPIEKKPFFHLLPATQSFSLATAGCNLDCKFCQNWEISQARPEQTLNYALSPDQVVQLARRYQCPSIASTYVEPTIFFEYLLDIARAARAAGLLKVMHSNGFINEAPLRELCRFLDAACIDLKAFNDGTYRELTGGRLQPVLDTLTRLKSLGVHTEIVNLVVPGKNDDLKEITAMSRWIREHLGADTPLHFTRFYPRYQLKSLPPTPIETLEQARAAAMGEGLHYVYVGNVPDHPGQHTICPGCRQVVIRRVGYQVDPSHLKDGRCDRCGQAIAGRWHSAGTG